MFLSPTEVNTPSEKYILAASNDQDMKIWIQALKKAAVTFLYHF